MMKVDRISRSHNKRPLCFKFKTLPTHSLTYLLTRAKSRDADLKLIFFREHDDCYSSHFDAGLAAAGQFYQIHISIFLPRKKGGWALAKVSHY